MPDIAHLVGSDLTVDASGDLAVSDGLQLGQERVLRRLITNPADYIWDLIYGAGLARFLGRPMAAARIQAIIRAQMFQEASVKRSPAPIITATPSPDGTLSVSIQYVDASTGQSITLPPVTVSANAGATLGSH